MLEILVYRHKVLLQRIRTFEHLAGVSEIPRQLFVPTGWALKLFARFRETSGESCINCAFIIFILAILKLIFFSHALSLLWKRRKHILLMRVITLTVLSWSVPRILEWVSELSDLVFVKWNSIQAIIRLRRSRCAPFVATCIWVMVTRCGSSSDKIFRLLLIQCWLLLCMALLSYNIWKITPWQRWFFLN